MVLILFISTIGCEKSQSKKRSESSLKTSTTQESANAQANSQQHSELAQENLEQNLAQLKEHHQENVQELLNQQNQIDQLCTELERIRRDCKLHSYLISRDQTLVDCSESVGGDVFTTEINVEFTSDQQSTSAVINQDLLMNIYTTKGVLKLAIFANPQDGSNPNKIIDAKFQATGGNRNVDVVLFDAEKIEIVPADPSAPLTLNAFVCVNLSFGGQYLFTSSPGTNTPGCVNFIRQGESLVYKDLPAVLSQHSTTQQCTISESIEQLNQKLQQ